MTSAHLHSEKTSNIKGMFTIKGEAILLSLTAALLIHTVKTTFHELMETMRGLTIAFGNKGWRGCQVMHYGGTEWVLSIESMLLALKVPRPYKSRADHSGS